MCFCVRVGALEPLVEKPMVGMTDYAVVRFSSRSGTRDRFCTRVAVKREEDNPVFKFKIHFIKFNDPIYKNGL